MAGERRGMTAAETVKRSLVLALGVFVLGLGIAICVKSDLGISPISTTAYTLHSIVPVLSLGTFVFVQNFVFLILTIILLGRDFRPYQLLQLPCSFLFGLFVDLWEWIIGTDAPESYAARFALMLLSVVVVGLGFSLVVTSGLPLDSNTAFVNALVIRTGKPYHRLKVLTDVIIVALAATVALIFLHRIVGIREGTLVAAVCIGYVAGFFNKRLAWMERRVFRPELKEQGTT
jgi:hypothetical protein